MIGKNQCCVQPTHSTQEAGIVMGLIQPGQGLQKLDAPFTHYGGPSKLAVYQDSASGRCSVAVVGASPIESSRVAELAGVDLSQLSASKAADWKLVKGSADMQVGWL